MVILEGANVFSLWIAVNSVLAILINRKEKALENSYNHVLDSAFPDMKNLGKDYIRAAKSHLWIGLKQNKIFSYLYYSCLFLSPIGIVCSAILLFIGPLDNKIEMNNWIYLFGNLIFLVVSPALYLLFQWVCSAMPDEVGKIYSCIDDKARKNLGEILTLTAGQPAFMERFKALKKRNPAR